ncbi:hypothetical protein NC651_001276 [Populus alba x Populus x berolinensis]|nr:hypothetical protein NC651_001276 [Populus alba x Populus x berolinensis]
MLNSKLVHIQLDEIDLLRYPEAKGDDNICRLGIANKNCGADDKAHTLEARKHNPHGTYEVYDHSFAATINAIDNTERLHMLKISFQK